MDRQAIGFEKIAAYAERFTPETVEAESGIYGSVMEDIARLIIKNRPHISIFPGAGLEHNENGVNCVRALAILSCLSGNMGAACGLFNPERPDLRPLTLYDELPLDEPPIGYDRFPVLYDVCKESHTMTAVDRMLGNGPYPLKGLLVAGANPAVTNPNTAKVEQALSRLDLLVVVDFFKTKTARLAHYILPAATFLEREDCTCFSRCSGSTSPARWPASTGCPTNIRCGAVLPTGWASGRLISRGRTKARSTAGCSSPRG